MTFYSALHYAAKAEKYASEASLHNLGNKLTNCITEIPQNIKLELNNGTLTLKAGSKVYVPNGAGKFDEVIVTIDISWGLTTYASGKIFVFYNAQNNNLFALNDYACFSGSSAPSGYANMVWYDTSNNKIKWTSNSGGSWNEGLSLPVTNSPYTNGTGFTSIDQVFNGFGYIGSTVYALPGVKGLIPDGRNADGSLKNIEVTTSQVVTNTHTTTLKDFYFCIGASGNVGVGKNEYLPVENRIRNVGQTIYISYYQAGSVTFESGVITSFTPKLPFRAADDQEVVKTSGKQNISGQKTFKDMAILNASNNAKAFLKSQTIDITTNPTANQTNQIYFGDKNEFVYGVLQANQNTDKQVSFLLTARNATSSYGSLGVVVYPDNSISTVAPVTPTNATGNQIATASWVRSKAAGFPNYSAAVSIADSTTSYTPPSNGIIQMGYLSAGDNSYSGGVTHSSGVDMVSQYSAYKYSNGGTFWCIVEKGVTYTLTSSQPNKKFIPFK